MSAALIVITTTAVLGTFVRFHPDEAIRMLHPIEGATADPLAVSLVSRRPVELAQTRRLDGSYVFNGYHHQ